MGEIFNSKDMIRLQLYYNFLKNILIFKNLNLYCMNFY